ncbi:hypothetical protein EV44_g3622 [Erysiphe necator]|uniref:Uncharacterized protein n=1 Tax=Uncinula necator TaxID=52586 RepID=A0A0B1PBW1_UNCNE|nr:hypothetical protein EV44_g3622 [Erysiphe necator]
MQSKKLLKNSSLKDSPILRKEDQLNGVWKNLIDGIRIDLDRGEEAIVSKNVMDLITTRITPQISSEPNTDRILSFLNPARPVKEAPRRFSELASDDELSDIPEEFADDGGPSTSSRPTSRAKRIASISEVQTPKRRTTRTNPGAGDD